VLPRPLAGFKGWGAGEGKENWDTNVNANANSAMNTEELFTLSLR